MKVNQTEDMVNHPKHYASIASVECITFTKELKFCSGNAFKYVFRAGEKDPNKFQEDLEKSLFYLNYAHMHKEKNFGILTRYKKIDLMNKLHSIRDEIGYDKHEILCAIILEKYDIAIQKIISYKTLSKIKNKN